MRRTMFRRIGLVGLTLGALAGLTLGALAGLTGTAQATTTLGNTAGAAGGSGCPTGWEYSTGIVVPDGGGTLTSFSFNNSGASTNDVIDFNVLRSNGDGSFAVVGRVGPRTISAVGKNTFPTSIPVQAGDVLAHYDVTDIQECARGGDYQGQQQSYTVLNSDPAVGTSFTPGNPFSGYTWNTSATLDTVDATAPACGTLTVAPDGSSATISPSDAGSGLASISNLKISNGTSTVTPFSPGAPSTTITVTKTDPALRTVFRFDVTDVAGNVTHCA